MRARIKADLVIVHQDSNDDYIPIGRHGLRIGSDPKCEVCIEAEGVLPRHATIQPLPKGFLLVPGEEADNILLNSQVVEPEGHPLRHRDQIRIGTAEFELDCPELGAAATDRYDRRKVSAHPRAPARRDSASPPSLLFESGVFRAIKPPHDTPVEVGNLADTLEASKKSKQRKASDQPYKDLVFLYKITGLVHRHAHSKDLIDHVIDAVRSHLDADRWSLHLACGNKLLPVVSRDESGGRPVAPMSVHRDAIQRCFKRERALTTRWRRTDHETQEQLSFPVICVPLRTRKRVHGVLYADRQPGQEAFDARELELLSAIGRQTGAAIETHELLRDVRHKELDLRDAQHNQLVARERLLERLLEAMSDGVIIIDPKGGLRVLNAAARRILGFDGQATSEALCGWLEGSELAWLADLNAPRPKSAAQGLNFRLQSPVQRFVRVVAAALPGDSKDLESRIVILQDQTREEEARERLRQSEKLSTLGELVAGIAHELNNPLSAVVGFAELLESGEVDLDTALTRIIDGARRARDTVRSLLTFARARTSERVPVDINSVLEGAADLLAYQMRVSDVKLVLDLKPSLPHAHGDQQELTQVFVNLMNNGLQALINSQKAGTVHVTSELQKDQVRITVHDDGPGISPEKAERIFQPFYTTKDQGTGLGLSVSWGIIHEHDGSLELVQVEDQPGACFVVELPAMHEPSESSDDFAEILPKVEDKPLAGIRAVAVDDEAPVLDLLNHILQSRGAEVISCTTNPKTAFDAVVRERPEVVLVDCKMPGISGVRFLEMLAEVDPELVKRAVMITGDPGTQETNDLVERFGVALLPKPFRVEGAVSLIAEVAKRE